MHNLLNSLVEGYNPILVSSCFLSVREGFVGRLLDPKFSVAQRRPWHFRIVVGVRFRDHSQPTAQGAPKCEHCCPRHGLHLSSILGFKSQVLVLCLEICNCPSRFMLQSYRFEPLPRHWAGRFRLADRRPLTYSFGLAGHVEWNWGLFTLETSCGSVLRVSLPRTPCSRC